jgi:hypothetical protein
VAAPIVALNSAVKNTPDKKPVMILFTDILSFRFFRSITGIACFWTIKNGDNTLFGGPNLHQIAPMY